MERNKISCSECLSTNCLIRKHCPSEVLADVDDNKIVNRYLRKQHIFHEDSDVYGIYFIQKGIIKVYKMGAFNKDQIIRFSLNGDILGHRGFSSSNGYPVSAQSITESEICYFTKDYFFSLLNRVPQLAINLMLFYASELNKEESKLRDMSIFTVREKVAKALLVLVRTFGINEKREINNIEFLSRQDIAEFVGLTPNQVTKVLSEFKQDEYVQTYDKKIRILVPEELEKIVSY